MTMRFLLSWSGGSINVWLLQYSRYNGNEYFLNGGSATNFPQIMVRKEWVKAERSTVMAAGVGSFTIRAKPRTEYFSLQIYAVVISPVSITTTAGAV
jgi:hypothetical protein